MPWNSWPSLVSMGGWSQAGFDRRGRRSGVMFLCPKQQIPVFVCLFVSNGLHLLDSQLITNLLLVPGGSVPGMVRFPAWWKRMDRVGIALGILQLVMESWVWDTTVHGW